MAASESGNERPRSRSHGVFKSGYLLVSSKGLGFKSWKKRWFLLTRTSLVFFKSEPRGPIDGSLALGGIDLNSSGRVHVRLDKRLLTLVFPDGRAFTLKTDALEELEEWRQALEDALVAAPNAALMVGQLNDTIFRQDALDTLADFSGSEIVGMQPGSRRTVKSLVVGRPILLALEDIDGSPSFLEKALRFIEVHGLKVEGILRESADVEHVEQRVREYEQGKVEFTEDENAHVIGDCIKHVLRELPSSPVPLPCCSALLNALKIENVGIRVEAAKAAVQETFPEPNRRLLQRVLKMMRTVAEHKDENRMTMQAVAACMAPLLLRPLLAGECVPSNNENEEDGGQSMDSAAQIIAATQSANQAQNIVVLLMDHFNTIFSDEPGRRSMPSQQISPSGPWDVEDEEDEDESERRRSVDLGRMIAGHGGMGSQALSESSLSEPGSVSDSGSGPISLSLLADTNKDGHSNVFTSGGLLQQQHQASPLRGMDWNELSEMAKLAGLPPRFGNVSGELNIGDNSLPVGTNGTSEGSSRKFPPFSKPTSSPGSSTHFPRGSRSGPGLEGDRPPSIPLAVDDEAQLQLLELTRQDLRSSLSRETRANAVLKETLVARKHLLADRRKSLQQEVVDLKDKLSAQRTTHTALENGLQSKSVELDPQTQAELAEIGSYEKDVARLRQELGTLQRQLHHAQQQQRPAANTPSSSDRRQKIEALLSLKTQLQAELERTMSLCLDEQHKNAELEEKRRRDDPAALELSVAQQRAALAEAQAALHSEMARGKDLRRRMQAAQRLTGSNYFNTVRSGDSGPNPMSGPIPDARLKSGEMHEMEMRKEGGSGMLNDASWSSQTYTEESPRPDLDQAAASAALAELSSRLEHFKERRSQLMRQLSALSSESPPRSHSRLGLASKDGIS